MSSTLSTSHAKAADDRVIDALGMLKHLELAFKVIAEIQRDHYVDGGDSISFYFRAAVSALFFGEHRADQIEGRPFEALFSEAQEWLKHHGLNYPICRQSFGIAAIWYDYTPVYRPAGGKQVRTLERTRPKEYAKAPKRSS